MKQTPDKPGTERRAEVQQQMEQVADVVTNNAKGYMCLQWKLPEV